MWTSFGHNTSLRLLDVWCLPLARNLIFQASFFVLPSAWVCWSWKLGQTTEWCTVNSQHWFVWQALAQAFLCFPQRYVGFLQDTLVSFHSPKTCTLYIAHGVECKCEYVFVYMCDTWISLLGRATEPQPEGNSSFSGSVRHVAGHSLISLTALYCWPCQ